MKKTVLYIVIGLLAGAGLMYLLAPARFPNERRPAEPTSFRAVAPRLDAGGDIYAYFSTERIIRSTEELVSKFVKAMPGQGEAAVISSVLRLIGRIGLNEISGLGLSNISVSPELHRTKIVVHHYPNKNKGLIWQLGSPAPRALTELDLLPADTVFGVFGELRLDSFWAWLKAELKDSDIPGAQNFVLQSEPMLAAQGVNLPELLGSLTGSVGFFVTLDKERQVTLPGGGSSMTIPEPGLALVVGVKNPSLFELIKSKLPMARFSEKPDRKTLQFSVLSAPIPLEPCITAVKDYLIVSTTPRLAEAILQARRQGDGLRRSDEFAALARYTPDKGNGFSFISPRLWRIYSDIIGQAAGEAGDDKIKDFVFSIFPKELKAYSVFEYRPDGVVWTTCHNLNPELMLLLPAVSLAGIAAAIAVPSMMQSGDKAKQNSTMSSLKSASLAIDSYLIDTAAVPDVSRFAELKPLLQPFYIKSLLLKDAWGNDLLYKRVGRDACLIASPGKDGIFRGWEQKGSFSGELFDQDLIISSGQFVFGPEIK